MVLPDSDGISRVPPYSGYIQENEVSTTGLLPSTTDLSRSLRLPRSFVTPYRMSYNPKRQASWFGLCSVSLAATQEIAFAFSSSRYLDVSVPWVCLPYPMYSDKDTIPLRMVGFPIRKSSDQSLHSSRSISALVRPSSTPSVKASTVRPF